MNIAQAQAILEKISSVKVLVVGDLMIDHYVWGKVERISAEAPVPVVEVRKEESRLGGAANVAYNCSSLGADTAVLGVTGSDSKGVILKDMLKQRGMGRVKLVADPGRPTTMKTRIIAGHQQVTRIDYEQCHDLPEDIAREVMRAFRDVVDQVDAVLLEDYNKGLLTHDIITQIVSICRDKHKIVTVDPKFRNFFAYKGCTVFKPNYIELQKNLGLAIENEDQYHDAANTLLERLEPEHLIITRGEKGLSVFGKDRKPIDIPTFAREVYDVSGAGDTVIATLTLALAAGVPIEDAALIANHAAGSVCAKLGIHPVTPADILKSVRVEEEK